MADTDTTAAPAGEDYSLTNPDTVTKYKVAGDIANRTPAPALTWPAHRTFCADRRRSITCVPPWCGRRPAGALKAVVDAAVAGAKVRELCELGDRTVTEAAQGVYRGKGKDGNKVERGTLAHPRPRQIPFAGCAASHTFLRFFLLAFGTGRWTPQASPSRRACRSTNACATCRL